MQKNDYFHWVIQFSELDHSWQLPDVDYEAIPMKHIYETQWLWNCCDYEIIGEGEPRDLELVTESLNFMGKIYPVPRSAL